MSVLSTSVPKHSSRNIPAESTGCVTSSSHTANHAAVRVSAQTGTT